MLSEKNIIRQFFIESIFFNIIGLAAAAIIVAILAPELSERFSIKFSSNVLATGLGAIFLIVFIGGTVLSGLYPSFVISAFKITSVIKGKITRVGYGRTIRNGLVVFQFALSFVLIAGTYVVFKQINFMMDKDLGMNIDQVLVVRGPFQTPYDSTFIDKAVNFKNELKGIPNILDAASSRRLPGRKTGKIFNVQNKSVNPEIKHTTSDIAVDCDFFRTLDIAVLAGRGFEPRDHNFDGRKLDKIVINESAVKLLGFENDEAAVGKILNFYGRDWTIVGVVENHHQQSPHVAVEPVIFTPQYATGCWFFLKVNTNDLNETMKTIDKKYASFFEGNRFEYFFLDEYFDRQYENDKDFRTLFTMFTSLGLVLASLGLLGLSFFTVAQRKKEVGIRKVSGATTQSILLLFLKDFTKLVLFAVVMSLPFAYFLIDTWLLEYAYRIDFGLMMFAVPALLTLLVAVLTVSYQTIKATLMNPIDPLKTE